jgi:pyrimidine-nucleoside phosphorylase
VNFLSLIEAKREGHALDPAQIKEIVAAYTGDKIHDYQMAAFLMAVYFSGMTDREVSSLTECMLRSGESGLLLASTSLVMRRPLFN